jgi:hypothetical protein
MAFGPMFMKVHEFNDTEECYPMLQLCPNCGCCDRDLPPEPPKAMMCSFECTFCKTCAETVLRGICPNCGGELMRRPVRPATALDKYPASTKQIVKKGGCRQAGRVPPPYG